jgi:hypothetical protein
VDRCDDAASPIAIDTRGSLRPFSSLRFDEIFSGRCSSDTRHKRADWSVIVLGISRPRRATGVPRNRGHSRMSSAIGSASRSWRSERNVTIPIGKLVAQCFRSKQRRASNGNSPAELIYYDQVRTSPGSCKYCSDVERVENAVAQPIPPPLTDSACELRRGSPGRAASGRQGPGPRLPGRATSGKVSCLDRLPACCACPNCGFLPSFAHFFVCSASNCGHAAAPLLPTGSPSREN